MTLREKIIKYLQYCESAGLTGANVSIPNLREMLCVLDDRDNLLRASLLAKSELNRAVQAQARE